jgi:hypothetical protein
MLVSDWQASPRPNTPDLLRGTCGMGQGVGRGPVLGNGADHGTRSALLDG